ncbi:sodium:solute symporter [Marinilongibacter aquaticus]|uniref:sodium:solute symporter n=1 Tax=Marinilongibacter aquaticus TaxID=2975157 RepID=UPI0021BD2997|nr:sodium:solute symporter [Marinilongibacter aquaticus]UBM59092.1 sodium:solute symporter [Marinilongibacter aquaticus]
MIGSLDIAIICIYLLAVLAFGWMFYRKQTDASSFTRGNGRLPVWALSLSVFATFVSSISFLALPGNAFAKDWSSFVFSLSIPITAFLAVRFFVPLYRKINSDSAYAFLEERFGRWARIYASVCYLLTQLARMGAILYLLALPVNSLTGLGLEQIIVITGLLVLLYSTLGGIEAVVYTDAIQGILLISGAFLCLYFILSKIDGGFGGMWQEALQNHKLSLGSFAFDWKSSSFWLILFYGFFINLQNFGADQSYIQRYMSAKSVKDAQKTVWLGGLLYVPVSLLFFLIGTALWVYYFQNPLPEAIPADQVFPHFISTELPVGIKGLLIAAILSAGMSTLSTSVNSSATVLLTDIFKIETANSLRFLRTASAIMAACSIVAALLFLGVDSALDVWWALASIFSGGILGLFLLGLLVKKSAAKLAVSIGLVFVLWTSLSQMFPESPWAFTLHPNFVIIIGTTLIFAVGWLLRKKD